MHTRLVTVTMSVALFLLVTSLYVNGQSTCPVANSNNPAGTASQRCKCGIKTDGHIYIYCARKQLLHLPKFTRSSILYDELILSGNRMRNITRLGFAGLKVKRLLLDDNPWVHLDAEALGELANYLEELVLSVSAPDVVDEEASPMERPRMPPRLFQTLLNLRVAKLSGLTAFASGVLARDTFSRARKLEVVHLAASGVRAVEEGALSGLEASLVELSLESNELETAQSVFHEVERATRRLERLNLARNRIRRLARHVSMTTSGLGEMQVHSFSYLGFPLREISNLFFSLPKLAHSLAIF